VRLLRPLGRRAPEAALEWLVVGLGNPGPRYAGTRHNVGRDTVRLLAQRHGLHLDATRFGARYGAGRVAEVRVGLAEPLTFMNLSGQAVAPLARFFKVAATQVLLVVDDLDLPLGTIRIRPGGGSGGHNGVTSVLAALGTRDVPRVRLGIGRPPAAWDAADYVLARFAPAEAQAARDLTERGADAVEAVLRDGLDAAMNAVNG
jgi:peptidyl-tRNA hydrolase, PTH1 family